MNKRLQTIINTNGADPDPGSENLKLGFGSEKIKSSPDVFGIILEKSCEFPVILVAFPLPGSGPGAAKKCGSGSATLINTEKKNLLYKHMSKTHYIFLF